eukprot:GFUD01005209.1.p1 GENE.GFUD01005209.1~~GFUD01005209.1.p1  ORF type:complete len:1622 (-),score=474.54 GFUD01005209.1:150-5015(-)
MAAVSNNGYTNREGIKTTSQEEFSEEDGYFTCAVSVQHKKHDFETSSAYSADSEHARKVVWPANQTKVEKQSVDSSKTFQNAFKQATGQVDQPHQWLQKSQAFNSDEHNEKASFEMRQGAHRMSRSNSRSKNIMDRARSFERAAAESRGNSRPASRTGSIASRHRSPSGTRGQVDEMWMNQLERPGSRTDVDSRRFGEIGKVQTSEWEGRIKGSMENLPTRTPPPKRREINMKRNLDSERGLDTKTPEPPPPPARMTYPPNTIKEPEAEFPPPPDSDTKSKLSEESVSQLSEENKENIVKQWVESTTQSAEDIAKELEKFAYDIAETVVSNMEKNSEKKDSFGTHGQHSVATASTVEQSQKTQVGSGIYFAAPASTTRHELHGPVYVQEENRRVGMTFQQEERRREELRKQEEAKQEEKRRHELEIDAQRLQEEQQRKLAEMQRAQEEEMRRKEESRRIEIERQQKQAQEEEMRHKEEARRIEIERQQKQAQEEEMRRKEEARRIEMERQQAIKKQEEESRRQAEIERQSEEKLRYEEMKRVEEQRLKQLEMIKIEEEKKRQEILRFEQLKQEEELKRQEEIRLEQEMRRQFEMKQQVEIQHQREQQLLLEQQQMLQDQKEQQLLQAQAVSVRNHIPKLSKTTSFEASQDRQNEIKHEDHLGLVKTGQVNEKRNFWIRSTSADRLNQVSLSPAPRRRRIDWNVNRPKENEDPESRPGSSLGQAQTGSVKNLSSGFIEKSKSSAAVMQDEFERGRPKQKTVLANGGWTKEQYDQKVKQDFLKSQEVKTNKVNETVQTWGKRDSSATGRTTPAPSRNIGEVFSDNSVGKTAEMESSANSWRTKTPEPTLKLVNVSVEKAIGSNQNIHISENAHKQMANFLTSSTSQQKEEVMSTSVTNTMSSQSSITSHSMSTTSKYSADTNSQAPPTPERNQSYGGKCENTIKPKTEPIRNEPKKTVSDATIDTVVQTSTEACVTDTTANIEQSVKTVSSNNESVKTVCPLPVSRQDQIQQTVQHSNVLQNSTSTQSINSVLSTCSSSALPVPVKQGWFDEMEQLSTTSNSSYAIPEGVLSPTGTGKTPLPVVANWFDALEAKITKPTPEKMSTPVRNEQAESKLNMVSLSDKACPDRTTSLLNEILDELVIDESALELHKSSEETGTIKRKQTEQAKIFISDDIDNRSVQSDATVIENKENIIKNEKEESVIVVPQSPREIRKKFQAASSFERSFTKSTDLEFSKEFKEGIKGKVKESRENFLRQASVDAKAKETNNKQEEMEEIKFHRAISQTKLDQEESKTDIIKQEKLRELEAVKRSRSKSNAEDDESVQNSYLQEKRLRELELLQLANRSTTMSWESDNRELQLREERNKELAELVNRTVDVDSESEVTRKDKIMKEERNTELALLSNRKVESVDITKENNTTLVKEERRKELEELSNRNLEIDWERNNTESLIKEERAKELLEISKRKTNADSEMEKSEQIWNERAEELKQIASMRSKSPWKQECIESSIVEKNFEFDAPELKGKVRNTAAAWKEREKSASRDREAKLEKDATLKDIPTRRIGSLFARDSDYWNLNEATDDFPEPPSDAEIAQVSPNPPPPLRQSSKGKIEEYNRDPNWNAPWRKS